MKRKYIEIATDDKMKMRFKKNRTIDACPGVYFLFYNKKIVYVQYSNDVHHAVTAMEHRHKGFDSWNYIPCFSDYEDILIEKTIADFDPVYNRPPEL